MNRRGNVDNLTKYEGVGYILKKWDILRKKEKKRDNIRKTIYIQA